MVSCTRNRCLRHACSTAKEPRTHKWMEASVSSFHQPACPPRPGEQGINTKRRRLGVSQPLDKQEKMGPTGVSFSFSASSWGQRPPRLCLGMRGSPPTSISCPPTQPTCCHSHVTQGSYLPGTAEGINLSNSTLNPNLLPAVIF